MRLAYVAAALAVLAVACTELDDVTRDRCGNGVIEASNGEDCDGAEGCGRPDTAQACRVLCDPDAAAATCPGQSACGLDGVCHAPGGEMVLATTFAWTSPHLLVADTSGDDYPELVGVANQQVEVRLGGPDLGFSALPAIPTPPLTGEPHAADLEGDGDLDIALPVREGVFTLSGDAATTLDPFFYNSFPAPGGDRRIAGAELVFLDAVTLPLIAAHDEASGVSLLVVPGQEQGAAAFPVGMTVDHLITENLPVGVLTTGSIVARTTALIAAGQRAVRLYDINVTLQLQISITARLAPVMLPLNTVPRPDSDAWFADFDGDGHQDLVVSVLQSDVEGLAVAWGNGNGALADSTGVANQATVVWRADRDQDGVAGEDGALTPLHVAQVTDNPVILGDEGDADVIGAAGLYTTSCGARNQCALHFLRASPRPWSGATVADVNADDLPDVIAFAGDQTGIDLLLNTAAQVYFNDATVPTAGAVERVMPGDFNGDGVRDLAYVDASVGVPYSDALSVSFGQLLVPPGPPVYMGSVGELVLGGRFLVPQNPTFSDLIDDLIVITEREVDGERVRGAAIAFGSTARRLFAPLVAEEIDRVNRDIQTMRIEEAFPLFGNDDAYADLAVLTSTRYSASTVTGADSQPVTIEHARFFAGASDGQAIEAGALELDPAGPSLDGAVWRGADVIGGDADEAIAVLDDGSLLVLELEDCAALLCATQVDGSGAGLADPVNLVVQDLDGDGDGDAIAVMRSSRVGERAGGVLVWWNDGGFSSQRFQPFNGPVADAAALDLDRDGVAELAVLFHDERGVELATHTAGGFTGLAPFIDVVDGVALKAVDVNGDALVDLVVVSGVERESPRDLAVYLQSEARL